MRSVHRCELGEVWSALPGTRGKPSFCFPLVRERSTVQSCPAAPVSTARKFGPASVFVALSLLARRVGNTVEMTARDTMRREHDHPPLQPSPPIDLWLRHPRTEDVVAMRCATNQSISDNTNHCALAYPDRHDAFTRRQRDSRHRSVPVAATCLEATRSPQPRLR